MRERRTRNEVSIFASQYTQEIHQVDLLLLREANVEPAVIEIHELAQRGSRAIRKIRGSRSETAKLLNHDCADIFALARDQRAAWILRVDLAAEEGMWGQVLAASDLEQRQLRQFFGPRTLGRLQRPGVIGRT